MKSVHELTQEILQLCQEKKKIHAIKLVHEHTQWGLKKSKEHVEMLISNGVLYEEETTSQDAKEDIVKMIIELCKNNKKIEAVKMVSEHTNWSLKESKNFVENLMKKTEENPTEDTTEEFYEMITKINDDTE